MRDQRHTHEGSCTRWGRTFPWCSAWAHSWRWAHDNPCTGRIPYTRSWYTMLPWTRSWWRYTHAFTWTLSWRGYTHACSRSYSWRKWAHTYSRQQLAPWTPPHAYPYQLHPDLRTDPHAFFPIIRKRLRCRGLPSDRGSRVKSAPLHFRPDPFPRSRIDRRACGCDRMCLSVVPACTGNHSLLSGSCRKWLCTLCPRHTPGSGTCHRRTFKRDSFLQ